MLKDKKLYIFILILISAIIRGALACFIELGNDEVYYHILSLHPQLSYFDHPPLVALMIHISTLCGDLNSEIAIRFFPILIGSINTYIIYSIARLEIFNTSDSQTNTYKRGLFAAILYTGSLYCSVLCGLFVMPDAPLSLFWLLSVLILCKTLPSYANFTHSKMLFAGLFIGLAMLSKYSGAYLWGATGLYILLFNRGLLTKWSLYVAVIISLIVFSPVLIWNFLNDFISFTFHSDRVTDASSFEPLYLAREIFGSIFYNGVVNFAILIFAIIAFVRKKVGVSREAIGFLLIFSVPIIVLFLGVSMFQATLPHWSAPGYFTLIILSAIYLANISCKRAKIWAYASLLFTFVTIIIASLQINFATLYNPTNNLNDRQLGRNDVTLDMYGWEQLNCKFSAIYKCELDNGTIPANGIDLLSYVWYEAAHIESYVASANQLNVLTIGEKYDTHFYEWLTLERGGYNPLNPTPAYFIISSRSFVSTLEVFAKLDLDPENPTHIVPIVRNDTVVEYFYLYRVGF